jgi:hypothetical protein
MTDSNELEEFGKRMLEDYPLEGENLLALTVPTSLDMLLVAIDQCRHFMDHSTSALDSVGRQYRGRIPARERNQLDAAIELFYRDVEGKAESQIERIGITADAIGKFTESHYPISQEAVIAAANVIFQKVNQEAVTEHFGKFFDEPVKFEYIFTRIRLGRAGR